MLTFVGMEPHGLESCSHSDRLVNEQTLLRARDEQAFANEVLWVLRELEQSVTLVARIRWVDTAGTPRSLTRNEAVLAGQMVRLAKLHNGLLRFCDPPSMELFAFVLRGAIESAVNLRYLIKHGTEDTYEAFMRHSMKIERQLRDRVSTVIDERGGIVMPMEHGMLEGIDAAFRTAQVDPRDVDPTSRASWSRRGAFGRFKELGLETLYGPYFGVQSSYVHGAWQELVQHHIDVQPDGSFLSRGVVSEERLAVAPLLIAVDVLGGAAVDYLRVAAPPSMERDVLERRIDLCGENAYAIRAAYRRFRGMPDLA